MKYQSVTDDDPCFYRTVLAGPKKSNPKKWPEKLVAKVGYKPENVPPSGSMAGQLLQRRYTATRPSAEDIKVARHASFLNIDGVEQCAIHVAMTEQETRPASRLPPPSMALPL